MSHFIDVLVHSGYCFYFLFTPSLKDESMGTVLGVFFRLRRPRSLEVDLFNRSLSHSYILRHSHYTTLSSWLSPKCNCPKSLKHLTAHHSVKCILPKLGWKTSSQPISGRVDTARGSWCPVWWRRRSILGWLLLTGSLKLCLGSSSSATQQPWSVYLLLQTFSHNLDTTEPLLRKYDHRVQKKLLRYFKMLYYVHLFIWRWECEWVGQRATGERWLSSHHVVRLAASTFTCWDISPGLIDL